MCCFHDFRRNNYILGESSPRSLFWIATGQQRFPHQVDRRSPVLNGDDSAFEHIKLKISHLTEEYRTLLFTITVYLTTGVIMCQGTLFELWCEKETHRWHMCDTSAIHIQLQRSHKIKLLQLQTRPTTLSLFYRRSIRKTPQYIPHLPSLIHKTIKWRNNPNQQIFRSQMDPQEILSHPRKSSLKMLTEMPLDTLYNQNPK